MPIEYYSDWELLALNEGTEMRDDNNGEKIICYACSRPIIGGSACYSCSLGDEHDFFLHKTCAELPKEIKYPMHPKHSLTLVAVRPFFRQLYGCNICRSESSGFAYICSFCKFNVDVNCTFEDCSFRHQSHDHNLTLLQRPASFHCDACDSVAEDLSYHCTVCPFWIHKKCASSPTTVELAFHSHPLTLEYSIPEKYRTFEQNCYICKDIVNPGYWIYMCAGCRIFTHMDCATSKPISENEADDQIEIDPNLMVFPLMPDQLSSTVHHFLESLGLEAAHSIEARDELHHWSHEDHPLILFENQLQSHEDTSEMKVKEKLLICDGCVKSINSEEDPYYGCLQCNFFLHKICATLPMDLKELHLGSFKFEQPLELFKPRTDFDYKVCDNCRIATNGFYLSSKSSNIRLDVRCAALPNSIKHEAHKHPLIQNELPSFSYVKCSSCPNFIEGTEYRCEACDFRMHSRCILLPRTIRHRWDPHPIALVYPPIPDHPDLFYCEICEEEIDTQYWLYFCGDCDQAFHIDCLHKVDWYANVKFGRAYEFDCHPHGLTFVRKSANKYPSSCHRCVLIGMDTLSLNVPRVTF